MIGPIVDLLTFLGGREQVRMVLVPWELMQFLFIYYFIILLFIYLFLIKSLFTTKYKYYTILKLESHSEELGVLKPTTSWLHPHEA